MRLKPKPKPKPKPKLKPKLKPNIAGKWDTFDQWVDWASRDIGKNACPLDGVGQPIPAVCIDSKGRRCYVGADFMRSRDDKAFPVYYFWDCTK